MKKNVIGMAVFTLLLAGIGVVREGPGILIKGVGTGLEMFVSVIPLLIAAFILAGMIQVLISKELINKWLGKDAGFKGILLGAVAGALIPGGPYVYYPIAASFLLSGAEIGTVLAFVVAKNLWTLSRLPMEIALVGSRITFVRYTITFIFPILVAVIANMFFKGWSRQIKEQVRELQRAGEQG
ncbi:MAG: permease [Peptococcaceae bacterium]